MLLTSSESVIWKVPAPSWARRKVREYKALSDDDAGAERKASLAKELPEISEYRLTFGTVTIAEEIKRDELLKTVRDSFEVQHGISPGDFSMWFLDKFVREREPEVEYEQGKSLDKFQAFTLWQHTRDMADWATFMSCLSKAEERKVSLLNGSQPAWLEIPIPAAWLSLDQFLKLFPRKLLEACVEVCNDLNPGVWELQMDDEAKNFGGVNVAT